MDTISLTQLRSNLKYFVKQVTTKHSPLRVIRQDGDDFGINAHSKIV